MAKEIFRSENRIVDESGGVLVNLADLSYDDTVHGFIDNAAGHTLQEFANQAIVQLAAIPVARANASSALLYASVYFDAGAGLLEAGQGQTPLVAGDVILDAFMHPLTVEAYDGTTPKFDFGSASNIVAGEGLFKRFAGAAIDATTSPGSLSPSLGAYLAAATPKQGGIYIPSDETLKAWVTTDGKQGGPATGATQGNIWFYVLIARRGNF